MTPRTLADLIDLSEPDEPADHTPATVSEPFEVGILRPGDQVHFLGPSLTLLVRETASGVGGGVMVERGATVTVTDELLRLNVSRNGESWLSLIDDEDAQKERWGKRVFARGPWPEDVPVIEPGTPEAKWALQRAMESAKQLPPAEARQARKAAYAAYGKPDGVTALGSFPGGAR